MATIKTTVLYPVRATDPVAEPIFYSSFLRLAYTEVSRQYNNGDGTGRYITYKYRGSKDALRDASSDWVRAGGKYQINEDGPYSEATVTFGGNLVNPNFPIAPLNPANEEPITRFEFRTEYVDASLFELPQVRAEAKKNLDTELYFSAIKLAAEDPKNNKLPLLVSQFPIAHQLVKRLARGQTSFQTHRVSLTRISTYSALNGLPATPPIISAVYSGLSLANLNSFPTVVRNAMPKPPTNSNLTPEDTVWAWLKTNDSTSLMIKTNQVERNETWTFAAWDIFVYPYDVDPSLLR